VVSGHDALPMYSLNTRDDREHRCLCECLVSRQSHTHVAVCWSVLQQVQHWVALGCIGLHWVALGCNVISLFCDWRLSRLIRTRGAVCCGVLQCVLVFCRVLQCVESLL